MGLREAVLTFIFYITIPLRLSGICIEIDQRSHEYNITFFFPPSYKTTTGLGSNCELKLLVVTEGPRRTVIIHHSKHVDHYYYTPDRSRKRNREEIIQIIQIVEQNRHEDVGLQSRAGNARTMSSQQAYQNRPVAVVSHR